MRKFRAPVPKRCSLSLKSSFLLENGAKLEKSLRYTAVFNGFNVIVDKYEYMIDLYSKGFFGKGSLSPGFPSHDQRKKSRFDDRGTAKESTDSKTEAVSMHKKSKTENFPQKLRQEMVKVTAAEPNNTNILQQFCLMLEDASTANENDSNKREQLHLMLEEAFYLSSVLNCLDIFFKGQLMSKQNMWTEFQNVRSNFIERYLSYQHFRTKGWVVKSGIKFGCDFVLYKDGPPFYHASYVVAVISNVTEDSMNQEFETFLTRLRITETTNKELLICRVTAPENYDKSNVNEWKSCAVSEFTLQRWIPQENRE